MKLFDNENRKIRCPRFSFDVELTLGGIIFDLQGVVVHTGRSTTHGHYITYRRRKFGASKCCPNGIYLTIWANVSSRLSFRMFSMKVVKIHFPISQCWNQNFPMTRKFGSKPLYPTISLQNYVSRNGGMGNHMIHWASNNPRIFQTDLANKSQYLGV